MKVLIILSSLLAVLSLSTFLLTQDKAVTGPVSVTLTPPGSPAPVDVKPVQQPAKPVRYFFNTEGHSVDEIHALLKRAEELQLAARENQQSMKIAMVMHGPDLDIFASKNYSMYKEIVDIAARLDAAEIIDFKACEMAMESRGLSDKDLPEFFERVPFGPAEIQQLEGRGYVRL